MSVFFGDQFIPLKTFLKSVPFLGTLLLKMRSILKRNHGRTKFEFHRVHTGHMIGHEKIISSVMNLQNYAKTSGTAYSAQEFQGGYHRLTICNQIIVGQRCPEKRLALLPISLHGKSILDLGCNQGGMIHHVRDVVSWAVGIDVDHRLINIANFVASSDKRKERNISFYVMNLEKEPLDLIRDFLPEIKVEICFILSVCKWLHNWREVVVFGQRISRSMLFETNGTEKQQEEQIDFLNTIYRDVAVLSKTSEDDQVQKNRILLFLTDPV